MKKNLPLRITIFPKDVENITGLSSRTSRRLLQKVRQAFAKSPGEFVTVKEFCSFYGFEETLVREFLTV